MKNIAFVFTLFLAPVLRGESLLVEAHALVWSGSTNANVANAQLELLKTTNDRDSSGLTFKSGEGFPKIIESATVKGLNAGFHIVLLGFCSEVDLNLLRVVRIIQPGAYFRKVNIPRDRLSCPKSFFSESESAQNLLGKISKGDFRLKAVQSDEWLYLVLSRGKGEEFVNHKRIEYNSEVNLGSGEGGMGIFARVKSIFSGGKTIMTVHQVGNSEACNMEPNIKYNFEKDVVISTQDNGISTVEKNVKELSGEMCPSEPGQGG